MTWHTDSAAVERERLADDPHRPLYHFLPPSNWTNDPNGLIHWKGRYHLFHQRNPAAPVWGKIHWGHAVSDDLVHWEDLPIALSPTPGGPDADGCWSGCAVDNDGVATLIYTGVPIFFEPGIPPQLPCIATGSGDLLLDLEKHPGNPVIDGPPEHLEVMGFRDHSVWREDGLWYQTIGSGIKGVGGAALLYRSPDLIDWEYLHPLWVGNVAESGDMWECPDFFPLHDTHFLFLSIQPDFLHTHYFSGVYADHRFTPALRGLVDHGAYLYAAQTFLDDLGRRIMMGWLKEGRTEEAQRRAGWAGLISLPRVLSARPDGALGMEPAPELALLRGASYRVGNTTLSPASRDVLGDVRGDCLELVAEFEPGRAQRFGLRLRRSPDGEEETLVLYDRAEGRLVTDSRRSSLSPETARGVQRAPLALEPGERLKLHVFLDRSVVEVFADGGNGADGHVCISDRIYPTREDSLGVSLLAEGGEVRLLSLELWEMGAIWPHEG